MNAQMKDLRVASGTSPSNASPSEMHGHAPSQAKDTWIFNAQATATLGFSLWYVYEDYLKLGVLPSGGPVSHFYGWASNWWFALLIAVFYFAAGYLYERHQHVTDFHQFATFMKREAIVLLVPYVSFTVLVLVGNSLIGANSGFSLANLGGKLFLSPNGSLGYFIVLMAIFVVTRTPQTDKGAAALMACAMAAKLASMVVAIALPGFYAGLGYFVTNFAENWIWFVLGVFIAKYKAEAALGNFPMAFTVCAFLLMFLASGCMQDLTSNLYVLSITIFGIAVFFSITGAVFKNGRTDKFYAFIGKYTMAIWLMHPILAQITLWALKLMGITNATSADGWGMPVLALALPLACYVFPVLVMMLLDRTWKFGFIVYPARYLKH